MTFNKQISALPTFSINMYVTYTLTVNLFDLSLNGLFDGSIYVIRRPCCYE